MSEIEVRQSFISFSTLVVSICRGEYLRPPKDEDLKRILGINEQRGLPGNIGSRDCQKWQWKNYPVTWAGQFKGKKKPTVLSEAIVDGELWIWGINFGSPGSLNDINILDYSSIVGDILQEILFPTFQFTIKGWEINLCYYLVDLIYPKWAIAVSKIENSVNRKEKNFEK